MAPCLTKVHEQSQKMIGRVIDHYRISEKIGEGGRGIVYKAEDTKLKRTVALKFLPRRFVADSESKERFAREAQTAARLNHPNIVTIYDLNEFEGQLYIVMEYIEGRTLQEVTAGMKAASAAQAARSKIRIMLQICEGLGKVHDSGVIHRDIKPQNIMVDGAGNVKILDFGMARLFGVSHTTAERVICGTLQYVSPELLNGDEPDVRSDIWSLGVMFFEMLCGSHPFRGETPEAVIHSILTHDPIPRGALKFPGLAGLERILRKALAKSPGRRYQRLEPLVRDLRRLLPLGDAAVPGDVPAAGRQRIAVAVLPFADMSPLKDQEYFCDGIAEEIVNMLTKLEVLKVSSRTSSFQFKGRPFDFRSAGKKLNVQYMLEGSVRKFGEKLRVTANLVQAADGCNVWSEVYDRELKDIFRIQDEIAMAIIDSLKLKLIGGAKKMLSQRHTPSLEAYNLYLKGRYFWNRRYEGGLKRSIECFRQCIAQDRGYALPYVAIAESMNIIGLYGFYAPKQAFPPAKAAAQRALEIDHEMGEAYNALGWVSVFHEWDWPKAEREFRRGIELNPNYPTGHEWYALALAVQGRFEEALQEIRLALELDPLSLIINSVMGLIYLFAHRFGEAREQLHKTLELDPNFLLARLWLGETHLFQKECRQAMDEFQKVLQVPGGGMTTWALSDLGSAHALLGQRAEALTLFGQLEAMEKERYVPKSQMAQIFFHLDENRAMELLLKAVDERDAFLPWAQCSPHFDTLRARPGFTEVIGKMTKLATAACDFPGTM
jgi:serine/threonine protein kinase/Tfp pilus assembly protein PilF